MKKLLLIVSFAVTVTAFTIPASAQTISNVCLATSPFTCGVVQNGKWLSIYGSSLPVASTSTGDNSTLVHNANSTSCSGASSCSATARSAAPAQFYWYESSTQINYNLWTAVPGVSPGGNVYTRVCRIPTGVCTAYAGPFTLI
jgi:hypothetical protein